MRYPYQNHQNLKTAFWVLCLMCLMHNLVSCAKASDRSAVSQSFQDVSPSIRENSGDVAGIEIPENLTQVTDAKGSIEEQIATLKQASADRKQIFKELYDKKSELLTKLQNISSMGCGLNYPIDKIEIFVNAHQLEQAFHGRHHVDNLFEVKQPEAEKTKLTLSLADDMSVTIKDLTGFFKATGDVPGFSSLDFAHKKIADIQYIRVERHGFGMFTTKDIHTEQTGLLGNKKMKFDRFKYYESHRFHLAGLKVVVSSQRKKIILYDNQSINSPFHFPTGFWHDPWLREHPSFVKLYTQPESHCAG